MFYIPSSTDKNKFNKNNENMKVDFYGHYFFQPHDFHRYDNDGNSVGNDDRVENINNKNNTTDRANDDDDKKTIHPFPPRL